MKFLILLLALKGLMPSKETRKKWAKRKKRAERMYRLAALAKKEHDKPKKLGVFKKAKLTVKAILFLLISIPLVAFAVKAFKKGKKLAAKVSDLKSKLPKKANKSDAEPSDENPKDAEQRTDLSK